MELSEFGEWGKDRNIGIAKSFCELCVCLKGGAEGEQAVPRGPAVLFSLKDFQFPPQKHEWTRQRRGHLGYLPHSGSKQNFVALPDQLNQPFKALSIS